MINLNDMAATIAEKEDGVRQVDIAQIKQIMKIFLEELALLDNDEIISLMKRYRN